MKSKNASLKDVAELAGVSFTLVSKYLTNNPQARMSPETKERIDSLKFEQDYALSAKNNPEASARAIEIDAEIVELKRILKEEVPALKATEKKGK